MQILSNFLVYFAIYDPMLSWISRDISLFLLPVSSSWDISPTPDQWQAEEWWKELWVKKRLLMKMYTIGGGGYRLVGGAELPLFMYEQPRLRFISHDKSCCLLPYTLTSFSSHPFSTTSSRVAGSTSSPRRILFTI